MTADALTGRLVADENQLAYDVPGASSFDLLFDGRRVWSFSADKGVVDPDDPSGLRRVPWPEPIRTRLDGHARIALRDPRTKTVLVTTDVAFGTSAGRVELVDDAGRPLALHKWGKLQRPFEAMPPEDLDAYLDFVDTLMDVLRTECGVEPFMSFGALLGAVRSGRLIGHDVDIDIGYFSETRYPVDMILEGMRIERVLRTHGWRVIRDNAAFIQVFAPSVGGVARNVDIFTSWVDVDGNLYQANDITTRGSRDDVVPLSEVELEGRMVPAPRNTELFLQAAYGPSWRVPDPTFSYGFNYERRRMRGWIGGLREERARWREHFVGAGGRERGEPSDFAHTVLPRLQADSVDEVIDLGCGDGRDSFFFASHGLRVLGLDVVPSLVRSNAGTAKATGLPVEFDVVSLGSLRSVLPVAARVARRDGTRAVYARHVVDELTLASQKGFWRFCSMVLRDGARLHLEFTVRLGNGHLRPYTERHAFPVTPASVMRAVERYGAVEIDRSVEPATPGSSRGPKICRMTLEWL